jgi:phosphoribosylaminoimidazolecarboxamide formyltransferase/IMP cyclohydrolase
MKGLNEIRTALVSVSNRDGLVEFARGLSECGIAIIATGGTAAFLAGHGIAVREISEITGRVEFLGGLVKTLHPAIHAGILADRSNAAHMEELKAQGWEKIDMVVVNFYPLAGSGRIENLGFMDIGGPTMARAASKNLFSCVPVTDPGDYGRVLEEISDSGSVGEPLRWELAGETVARTACYDAGIHAAARRVGHVAAFPGNIAVGGSRAAELRYGENPHQAAAYYSGAGEKIEVLKGELSYNNILDVDCCLSQLVEFEGPAAVVVKHVGPCGAARGGPPEEALARAYECDPLSAFGGVIGVNFEFDEACAGYLARKFVECVVAPSFSEAALARLAKKKRTRLVRMAPAKRPGPVVRSALGGLLAQSPDDVLLPGDMKFVSGEPGDGSLAEQLAFAWAVVKHVKSNAIVLARGLRTIGIGAGQPSRIDSTRIAIRKAGEHGHEVAGSVMASDGFFPFPDCVEVAHENGVVAVVQPGGSIRDEEVIARAAELGVTMALTSMRHFRH